MHLEGGCHIGVISQGIGGNGIGEDGTHHAAAGFIISAMHPGQRNTGGAPHVYLGCKRQQVIERRAKHRIEMAVAATE